MTDQTALTESEAEALRVWLVENHQSLGLDPTSAPSGLVDLWALVRRLLVERATVAWDGGHDECCAVLVRHCATAVNPYLARETP